MGTFLSLCYVMPIVGDILKKMSLLINFIICVWQNIGLALREHVAHYWYTLVILVWFQIYPDHGKRTVKDKFC